MALVGRVVLAVACCVWPSVVRQADALLSGSRVSTPQLAAGFGYAVQSHEVATADGYLLTLHRLLRPSATPWTSNGRGSASHGTPVLLGHGLGSNSEQWVMRQDQNLVFELLDHGFDVWLGNYRGSLYGRKHTTLSTKSHKFWDFSWHENGVLDQAALIDHVLNVTGRAALLTIGFSMSCATQLVLQAERPEYNAKVLAAVLVVPPAYFRHPDGLWKLAQSLSSAVPFIQTAYSRNVKNDKLFFMERPLGPRCTSSSQRNLQTCKTLVEFVVGKSNMPLTRKSLRVLLSRYPAGASIRQTFHFGQSIITDGTFRRYDYGSVRNMKEYGSATPPAYNLSAVTSPAYIYYGGNDLSVNFKDVEQLARDLKVVKRLQKVEAYNHFDFIFDGHVGETVNKHIIEDLKNYV